MCSGLLPMYKEGRKLGALFKSQRLAVEFVAIFVVH
jgi:hypothetical protein